MTTKEIITKEELIEEVSRVITILKTEVLYKPVDCNDKVDFNSHLTHLPIIFKLYIDYSDDAETIAHVYADEFLKNVED